MKISNKKLYFGLVVILATGAALWGISTADQSVESPVADSGDESPEKNISHNEETITDEEGKVLLTTDDVPGSMQVSAESEFGAAGPFGEAILAPDSKWIAFTTGGTAHDGGWLYELESEEIFPVAFQYGGGVRVLEWSPDGNFVAFGVSSPAGTEHILVIDRENIDGYVSDIGQQIEVEEEMDPPFAYEFVAWEAPHTLCYSFEAQAERCVDVTELY